MSTIKVLPLTEQRTAYIGDVFIDSFGGLLVVILLLGVHKLKEK